MSGGFTLMEILIVFAIVAILIALLFPTLSNARTSAHAAQCQSNLRALASAGLSYAADKNGYLPDRTRWKQFTETPYSIIPYAGQEFLDSNAANKLKNTFLTCPATQSSPWGTTEAGHRTYSINQYATGSDTSSGSGSTSWISHVENRDAPVRLLNVESPASMAFFMDGTALQDTSGYRYSVYTAPDRLERISEDTASWRTVYSHNDTIYVAFLDGHVAQLTYEEAKEKLIGPTNPSASQAHLSPRTRPFWGAKK